MPILTAALDWGFSLHLPLCGSFSPLRDGVLGWWGMRVLIIFYLISMSLHVNYCLQIPDPCSLYMVERLVLAIDPTTCMHP